MTTLARMQRTKVVFIKISGGVIRMTLGISLLYESLPSPGEALGATRLAKLGAIISSFMAR